MSAVKRKLISITIIYWVLLLYIIAALIWWFISLEAQNHAMKELRINELVKDDPAYYEKFLQIQDASRRKSTQYISEGITFFVLIMVGALFVYRAVRRQIKLSQQQQNFMMAITHELKTPIAVTKLNLETILKRDLDVEKKNKLIENTLQEADRLNELCNNVLFAAQLDAGVDHNNAEQVDLSGLVITAITTARRHASSHNFTNKVTEEIYIKGDPISLQMLISNLLENAIKYSPKGSNVTVTLEQDKHIVLCVSDEGPGIPAQEKKKIFDKFYRMGDEITRRSKGTGLGLYICQRIAAAHNASVIAEDNKPKGTTMKVIFR